MYCHLCSDNRCHILFSCICCLFQDIIYTSNGLYVICIPVDMLMSTTNHLDWQHFYPASRPSQDQWHWSLVSTVTGKLESTDRLQSIVLKIQSGTPQTLHQPCLYIKPVYSPAKLLYLIKCLFLFTFF